MSMCRALYLSAVVLIACLNAHAEVRPCWIMPPGDWGVDEYRCFRVTFTTDEPVTQGELSVSADDEFEVWVNGRPLGTGAMWPNLARFDLHRQVCPVGKNVIAVRVLNLGGAGGFSLEARLEQESGTVLTVNSGAGWKVHESPNGDWTGVQYDDSGWSDVAVGRPDIRMGPSFEERDAAVLLEQAAKPFRLPWDKPMPERFVGETIRSHSPVWKDIDAFKGLLDKLKAMGFNMICIDIPWGRVETAPGVFEFDEFDVRMNEIVARGLYPQIKLNLLGGTVGWGHPPWIAARTELRKQYADGKYDRAYTLTYASEELNAMIAGFFEAVAHHYRDYPVVNYSLFASLSGEAEYAHNGYQDYSEPAKAQFREWLKARYGTVNALNELWGTSYVDFADAHIPVPKDPVPDGEFDFDPAVVDFYKYREFSLDRYLANAFGAIKQGDPDVDTALTVGHVLSWDCARRNTLSAYRWLRHADCLWIDPAPRDYYQTRVSIGRAAKLMGKKLAVEIDGLYAYERDEVEPLSAYTRQTCASFAQGADIFTVANWQFIGYGPAPGQSEFERLFEVHRAMASHLQPGAIPVRKEATDAVYISKWTMFATHGNRKVWDTIEDYYKVALQDESRLVDIISDDVFIDDPCVLERYERIHIPYAPVIAQDALDALTKGGVKIIAEPPVAAYDEYGNRR